jgi:chorismate dehydratase
MLRQGKPMTMLRLGRIEYLNVWPLFHHLERRFPPGQGVEYVSGHPTMLNAMLSRGDIAMAPCSSYEYLLHGGRYDLLPGLSISARTEVQSVLLLSPVPIEELPDFLGAHGNTVSLTSASATSAALLKILFRFAWGIPDPEWKIVPPGTGSLGGTPSLEIGDIALRHRLDPPPGWHVTDLAGAWESLTGLPFVFGVWIVRRDISPEDRRTLGKVSSALLEIKERVRERASELTKSPELPPWIGPRELLSYWGTMIYDFGPEHQASLILFGHLCCSMSLLESVPGLTWFSP